MKLVNRSQKQKQLREKGAKIGNQPDPLLSL
jgi:hypothetical protein